MSVCLYSSIWVWFYYIHYLLSTLILPLLNSSTWEHVWEDSKRALCFSRVWVLLKVYICIHAFRMSNSIIIQQGSPQRTEWSCLLGKINLCSKVSVLNYDCFWCSMHSSWRGRRRENISWILIFFFLRSSKLNRMVEVKIYVISQ